MNYTKAKNKSEILVKNRPVKQRFDKLMTKSVNVTPNQVEECIEYANNEVNKLNNFKHLVPSEIKDLELQKEVVMQNIFIQKIGECGFVNYLMSKNISEEVINKHKIGIKVAVAKEIHTRLIIEKSEFEKLKKNYYVGIHLNLEMEDKKDKIKRHLVKNLYNIKTMQIFGYLDYKFVNELRYETVKNKMGKKEFKFYNKKATDYEAKNPYANILNNDCKWYYLDKLMPIDNLINKLK
ncbi:hypothetical protein [Romboutsia sp.]|uniref:hypothetical protein n=1 Tax=Romboutsia sp. TaxID=1965302 RepID=UPI003F350ACA